jgi:Arc/MetJ-type ribon-helix-helix transcriptional regulator
MVRTQIQITEHQAAKLKQLADYQEVSMAELIRRAIDQLLASMNPISDAEQQKLALAFLGQFPDIGDATDVSENHDRYLTEIYAQVAEPQHT